ncbi:MAG: hypothetical protein KDC83_08140 [Flavobacteriales bacterium]|nr:hypothetical protein [Flavobacteriales bacterium]
MKPILISNSEIDRAKWNARVDASPNNSPFMYSWYLDVVCPRWEAIIMGDYISIYPIPVKVKWGKKYLFQPPYYQKSSIIGTKNRAFSDFIWQTLGNYSFGDFNSTEKWGIQFKELNNYVLDLNQPEEVIRSGISKNHKRNMSKSKNAGNAVKLNSGLDYLEPLIQMFLANKGKTIKKDLAAELETLKELCGTALKYSALEINCVYDQHDVLLGGIFIMKSRNRKVLMFMANGSAARDSGAMHQLVAETILDGSGNTSVFDFEGSMNPGIARFYSGFGAIRETYYHYKKATLIRKLISGFKSS